MDLSTEAILEYNPDQIIVLLTEGSTAPYKKLSADPLWADVRANKEHQVYFMDRDIWARSHGIETLEIMYNKAISTGFLTAKPVANTNK
jgi:iron complex transport system substrate-binding protein